MSLLKLSGIFAHELFARKKLQRSTERLKKLSTEKIAHATMNGGSILGRVAPGYLFQTVHITKTIAQCHNVLDIGCGTGEQLLQVATVCPNVNFTGIDHSDFILRKAQEQADKKGITNINFLKSHAESLKGISDNSYDGVISTMTLHHLANYNQLIQVFGEIKRILIPNGAIYLEDFTLFKSYKTINFFVDKDAPSPRDSFSELYEASMCAAFPISDLSNAMELVFGDRVKMYFTKPIPFLAVMKTESYPLTKTQKDYLANLVSGLSKNQAADYKDLTTAFRWSGLSL
ncbi:MAG: class I SAM-dependent methyltransferase [Bdellovibrionales bacterium]|nr:class I SAM-dependent methyltransferase [Bdellovibrionales bacterium]